MCFGYGFLEVFVKSREALAFLGFFMSVSEGPFTIAVAYMDPQRLTLLHARGVIIFANSTIVKLECLLKKVLQVGVPAVIWQGSQWDHCHVV